MTGDDTTLSAVRRLDAATRGLADVRARRMFGCEARFVGDAIFALVWKTGEVGVKLTDADAHAALRATGCGPWDPYGNGRGMQHWLLLPADVAEATLAEWVARAHRLAQTPAPAGKRRTPAKSAASERATTPEPGPAKPARAGGRARTR